MDNFREEVQEVFRDVFADDSIMLADEMTADDVEGWDSLAHINLVIALERRFGIKFATAEIARMKDDGQNVGTLIQLLATKTARQ